MKICSTRSQKITATAPEAVLQGIAPDGGLYIPNSFSGIRLNPAETLTMSAVEISAAVIDKILPDFGKDEMRSLIESAYKDKFETPDLTPVVKVGDAFVLELFRGPTSAFKDVALSVLPRLICASREKLGVKDEIMILTATSGDTGKAALEGFHDVPGTRIVVFYPDGGVSDVQRMQMVTQSGENVKVCAIKGNFDDAQTGVKKIFAFDRQENRAKEYGVRLSSANSINLGRLAPQIAYYYKAYADCVLTGEIALGDEVNFVVPTGNFGDILAGEFARRMGLPVGKLICASNANNVLTDFIRTGCYDRRRTFYKTISPSMDILVSSNLERYLYLASNGDADLVAKLMQSLNEEGVYQVPGQLTDTMHKHFDAYCADDALCAKTIRRVWEEEHYLLDPHTAVAWSAMEQFKQQADNGLATIVLSTASPYKFSHDVLAALGGKSAENGFEAMDALNALTGVEVPKNLAALRNRKPRFCDCVEKDAMLEYVMKAVKA